MSWLRNRMKVRLSRPKVAVLLLGLFLSVFVLANSSTLHHVLHPTADSADHHCAVTLLLTGQVEVPALAAAVAVPAVMVEQKPAPEISHPAGSSFNLPLSRGPPAQLS